MPRIHRTRSEDTGSLILVIDDVAEVLESSRRLLEAEGHRVVTAPDGPSGIEAHARERPHVILVDYFMPGMTGEEVVRRVREVDPHVQIILTTGYSGEKPAREMMRRLDIQGYHDKSEGPQRLLLWVDAAVKTYGHVRALEAQRAGLEYLVHAAPDVHRLQRLDELLPGLLRQLEDLLEGVSPASAGQPRAPEEGDEWRPAGFVALSLQPVEDPQDALAIRTGHGRFFPGLLTDSLGDRERSAVARAIEDRRVLILDEAIVLPLRIGARVLGVAYLEVRAPLEADPRLLEIFAVQAACAVQSALLYGEDAELYEMATRDPATGLLLHGHWSHLAHQVLKSGLRRGVPVSALRVELEGVEALERWAGPAARERAIRAAAGVVGEITGEGGWTTRRGPGGLLVLLPDEGTETAERLTATLAREGSPVRVDLDDGFGEIRIRAGCATLLPSGDAARLGLIDADRAEAALAALIDSAEASLHEAATDELGVGAVVILWDPESAARPDPGMAPQPALTPSG